VAAPLTGGWARPDACPTRRGRRPLRFGQHSGCHPPSATTPRRRDHSVARRGGGAEGVGGCPPDRWVGPARRVPDASGAPATAFWATFGVPPPFCSPRQPRGAAVTGARERHRRLPGWAGHAGGRARGSSDTLAGVAGWAPAGARDTCAADRTGAHSTGAAVGDRHPSRQCGGGPRC